MGRILVSTVYLLELVGVSSASDLDGVRERR
jgi:hypothetical protein